MLLRRAALGTVVLALTMVPAVRSELGDDRVSASASPAESGPAASPDAASPDAGAPATSAADRTGVPVGPPVDLGFDGVRSGADAVAVIGDDLPAVAAANRVTEEALLAGFEDPTTGIDGNGALVVTEAALDEHGHDEHAHDEGAAEQAGPQAALAPVVPLDQTFTLNSKPDSLRTIYLDFDGHHVAGTAWNDNPDFAVAAGFHPGYSQDAAVGSFSDAERTFVQDVWQRVAEDYAPFDVNVTTQDPGDAAITRSSPYDQRYGARALVSSSTTFPARCGAGCAGVAFVGVLDEPTHHAYYQTAWIKAGAHTFSPQRMALVISHEVGHNAGLNHAGITGQAYYGGHDHWGPIMGAPYARAVTQWTDHGYANASTAQVGSDLAVLDAHGLQPRADEAGATISGAPATGAGVRGFISDPTDVDVWSIGTCSRELSVQVEPATPEPDLDVRLTLLDAAGRTVGSPVDPLSAQTGPDPLVATGMAASLTTTGTGGPYYVSIDGTGRVGIEGTGRSHVYSDHGSLGAYTVSVQCGSFADVLSSHVFVDAIEWLAAEGISTGYPEADGSTTYRPSQPVLREQMAAFLYRFVHAGANPPASGAATRFADVAAGHVFAQHIGWLDSTGITTGYTEPDGTTTYRPSQPVLREQMAAFLYRLADKPAVPNLPTTSPFTDVATTHTFYREIVWLWRTGITTGYVNGDGTRSFAPSQPVLREQMAAFLFRFADQGLVPGS